MGTFLWSPTEFWKATTMDLKMAIEGYKNTHMTPEKKPGDSAPSRREVEVLKAQLGAR